VARLRRAKAKADGAAARERRPALSVAAFLPRYMQAQYGRCAPTFQNALASVITASRRHARHLMSNHDLH
jgi:hypothetical protein